MGKHTQIEYCDSTLNLIMACNGCEIQQVCYAKFMVERYKGQKGWPDSFDDFQVFTDRINLISRWSDLSGKERSDKPWLNHYPRIIFLNDLGDTFAPSMSPDWLRKCGAWDAMTNSPHIYLLLTKWPHRMAKFFSALGYVPGNVWLGTTYVQHDAVNLKRVNDLLGIKNIDSSAVTFVSFEPLLGEIPSTNELDYSLFDWFILGGESTGGIVNGVENDLELIEKNVLLLLENGFVYDTPVFFRQWGYGKSGRDMKNFSVEELSGMPAKYLRVSPDWVKPLV